ncbi:MAG: hypothetical protein AABZ39_07715 [Spirochaetota bacterium]
MRVYGPVKIIVLVLSAILAMGLGAELVRTVFPLREAFSRPGLFFLAGALVFAVASQFITLPSAIYVFGHELTHALAVLISGGKVTSFKVRSSGGMVTATESNSFIALAPYFLPVYTVIIVAVYNLIDIFIPMAGMRTLYYFLLGVSYGFHIGCTAAYTRSYQPDLRDEGIVFSTVMIVLANLIVLTLVMKLLFANFDLYRFYVGAFRDIWFAASGLFRWLALLH